MTATKILAAALLAGSTILSAFSPANAAPLARDAGLAAPGLTEQVQYRHHHHYRGHHGHRGGGLGAGALIGGLAAGAIIGGAVAAGQAQAAANERHAYCAQRYRSYDPGSGTFLGRDGRRYYCQ